MASFLIVYEKSDRPTAYFIRIGLGIFWECGPRAMAKEFKTRAAAVKVMQQAGKHRQGWRVVREEKNG